MCNICSTYDRLYHTLISWEQSNILTKNWPHNICSHDATCAEHGPSLTHFAARIGCRSWRPAWKKSARGENMPLWLLSVVMLLGGSCSWFCNSSACRLFDATLAFLPPSPQACNLNHGVPWSFRFQGVQLPTFTVHQIIQKCKSWSRMFGDLPPDIGNTQHTAWIKKRWTSDIIPMQPIEILYIESVPRLLYMIGCETAHYSFVWEHWTHVKKCRIYGPRYREDRRFQRGTIDRFSLPLNHCSTDMINMIVTWKHEPIVPSIF